MRIRPLAAPEEVVAAGRRPATLAATPLLISVLMLAHSACNAGIITQGSAGAGGDAGAAGSAGAGGRGGTEGAAGTGGNAGMGGSAGAGGTPSLVPNIIVHADLARPGSAAVYLAGVTAYHWKAAWVDFASLSQPARTLYLTRTQPGIVLLDFIWPAQDGLNAPTAGDFVSGPTGVATLVAPVLDEVLAAGGSVFLQLGGPPRWASKEPTNTDPIIPGQNDKPVWAAAPPDPTNGYATWTWAVTQLGGWLQSQYAGAIGTGRVLVAYGMELDNEEFYGPISEYISAFDVTASALKAASPLLRVGGGGNSNPWAIKHLPILHADTPDALPILQRWLAGCQTLGCAIDFVYWHLFTALPVVWAPAPGGAGASNTFADMSDQIASWQSAAGYGSAARIPVDITSWEFKDSGSGRIPAGHPWLSSEHDTEYKGAYIAAATIAMQNAGVAAHTIGALFETDSNVTGEFIGDWGHFTRAGVIKPAFNAASMASQLGGSSLRQISRTAASEQFVFVEAGVRASQLLILLSRFVPDTDPARQRRLLLAALGMRLLANGHTSTTLCAEGLCNEADLVALLTAHDTSGFASLSPATRALFDGWFALDDAAAAASPLHAASIRIDGATGSHPATVYRLDAGTSNAYNHCVRASVPNDCTSDVAAINDGPAQLQVVATPVLDLSAEGASIVFDLAVHDVVLVVVDGF